MGARAEDIRRATRRSQIVTREDAAIKAQFPDARDQIDNPEPGFFEDAADAQAALAFKAALAGQFRRRAVVALDDPVLLDPAQGIPTWSVSDAETGLAMDVLVTRFEMNCEDESARFEGIG